MPKLIRMYIDHVFIGFGISAVFVAMVLWFNVANLWHLVTHSADGLLAVFLLWAFNGLVFAGVQFGIAIMLMVREGDTGQGGGTAQRCSIDYAKPIRVKVGQDRPRF